jgi:DNA-binding GntR family transcriptional regulator
VSATAARRRVPRIKTSAAVVDYVLEQLFDGSLKSGDRIDLELLCDELGVSRLPVREALVMLERDGIVSTKYHRGVFVEPFDAESIIDDFEIMGMLSGLAVQRLAEKQDAEAIERLQELHAELRKIDTSDQVALFEKVQEIMTTEHRAGGSRRLRAELRAHSGFLPQAFRFINRGHAGTVKAHTEVLRAVVDGDGETAARLRLEDFRDAGRRVVRELTRQGVLSR